MENIFRAVNIALVNELKVIFDKMGIDIWEVIAASSTKPFGFMPFYPGPGLGGHCIPIDPFYLSWKAKQFGVTTRFIELAGEVNVSMPDYVMQKISFARAFLSSPDLLILDEATSNLDKESKLLIHNILKTKNFTIINSTHNIEDIDYFDLHLIIEEKENQRNMDLVNYYHST